MPPAVGAFPKHAIIRRVSAEPAVAMGAGRALLLQLASPAVAQGVHDHSEFKRNPFKRLQGTLEAMYGVVFGSEALADGIGRRVQWIHEFVVGPGYTANDPAHLLWVHATLLDTALRCYEELVEPLTADERERYYEEMAAVAGRFGCPREAQPATYADFRRYFDDTVAAMEVSDVGRDLGGFILAPVLPLGLHVPTRPVIRLQGLLTAGMLPASLREQFGVSWTERDQARYDRVTRRARTAFRVAPRSLRTLSTRIQGVYLLGLARRHVRRFDARLGSRDPVR
ncbi:MAG TPA: oxygenase MpaB family protein [Acidimicrobiales bacterium]|nr:oxygenase MpaB family protein [Acidimicrobiales bacterium]